MSNEEKEGNSFALLTLSVLLFLGVIALYALEYPFLSNTLQIGRLVKSSVTMCFSFVIVILIIGYTTRSLSLDSISFHILFSLFFLAISPYLASVSNRKLMQKKPYAASYEFKEQKGYNTKLYSGAKSHYNTYWIVLNKDERAFTFRTNTALPKNPNFGSKVRLVMNRGFWGFDYFDGESWEFM